MKGILAWGEVRRRGGGSDAIGGWRPLMIYIHPHVVGSVGIPRGAKSQCQLSYRNALHP